MNIGEVWRAHAPEGSPWDEVRVIALDVANRAIVIVPNDGSFTAPEGVERDSFVRHFEFHEPATDGAAGTAWESTL